MKRVQANSVGIRDLKANLSRHLRRVRAGERLTITDRGRPVAWMGPAPKNDADAWIWRMVAEGRVRWNGRKFVPPPKPVKPRTGSPSASDIVLEDRR